MWRLLTHPFQLHYHRRLTFSFNNNRKLCHKLVCYQMRMSRECFFVLPPLCMLVPLMLLASRELELRPVYLLRCSSFSHGGRAIPSTFHVHMCCCSFLFSAPLWKMPPILQWCMVRASHAITMAIESAIGTSTVSVQRRVSSVFSSSRECCHRCGIHCVRRILFFCCCFYSAPCRHKLMVGNSSKTSDFGRLILSA